jgi:hypothetical protein
VIPSGCAVPGGRTAKLTAGLRIQAPAPVANTAATINIAYDTNRRKFMAFTPQDRCKREIYGTRIVLVASVNPSPDALERA